ncbi:hypothetical protein P3T36_004091 [Kitasatospora sp. MAP12-15]|uniref:XRE family transcriptional regulator n=1 Tax=unclassified Kitasatospora TaxID=2633591 RepID=UPI0024763ECE|nr:XRE family transcriptional regulator [Kitasatospora sp. MAP12-44]MDH6115172.1 hypothetical protein [Kitasatospora sp. MAP12-44]
MSYWTALPDGLSPDQRQLVEELRALKDAHRLSLKQLGVLTHYSHASWERWLNGKRLVTREALAALAGALGVDGTRLLRLLGDVHCPLSPPDGSRPPTPAATVSVAPASVPAQLPAVVADFTGRREQLDELVGLLTTGGHGPGQVPVVAVTGAGGLGKTALAVQAGHLAALHFPDGQLYADLRGADLAPRDPTEVLGQWLRALGEDAGSIPSQVEELAARFRSLLAGRRVLVVLDNAAGAAQIRSLIPGTAGCAVLITARTRLSDLLATRHLPLSTLDDQEAGELLAAVISDRRTAAEPEAVARVLAGCGGVPLALRIAGARLADRTTWAIATLADRLEDERHLLDELTLGDLAIRTAFHTSYHNLPGIRAGRPSTGAQAGSSADGSAAWAFRLLGLCPSTRFTAHAAAALLDLPLRRAEDLLDTLVEAHLVEVDGPDRYRLHDLLRTYAAELTRRDETTEQRQAACERLAGWYLRACYQARQARQATRLPHGRGRPHGRAPRASRRLSRP